MPKIIEKFGKIASSALAVWALVLMVAGGLTQAYFAWTELNDRLDVIDELDDRVRSLERGIEILGAPSEIVEYSPSSHLQAGCAPGSDCILFLRIRRAVDAIECKIIPEATSYSFLSYADFVPRNLEVSGGFKSRDIGPIYELLEIQVRVPVSAPIGVGEVRASAFYRKCPWQVDGVPPVSQVSPAIRAYIGEKL